MTSSASTSSVYTPEHEMFRETVRKFIEKEMEPRLKAWEEQGSVDRDIWYKAGEAGMLGLCIPEEYGGPGADDLYNVILSEELGHYPCGATVGASFTSDIASHLLVHFGTHAQKQAWCPKILAGEAIQSLALTEPGAGSDVSGIITRAKKDGDDYILNGNKTYISNGNIADLLYVVARTDDFPGSHDMTIFMVDCSLKGVESRGLKTMGASLYPVGELFFDNVRLTKDDILGEEGKAFKVLLSTFALDRIQIAARSLAAAELAFDLTLDFVKNRKVFGKTLFEFQNTQFKLAEMKTELTVGRDFFHACLDRYVNGTFDMSVASMAKIWVCEMEQRVANECVQLHGGAGYMDEYTISRIYTNARLQTIYAGTTEMQKVAIAKTL
jgi:alkylation response protein AidB-like acyl-CoA dehydrogenase